MRLLTPSRGSLVSKAGVCARIGAAAPVSPAGHSARAQSFLVHVLGDAIGGTDYKSGTGLGCTV